MATKKKAAVDPKLERWKQRGESLARAKNGNQWAIADWMYKGEGDFKKRKPYQSGLVRLQIPPLSHRLMFLGCGSYQAFHCFSMTRSKRSARAFTQLA
jgi:hypothetical protein